ncbi:MAG TPA: hypothetical protein VNH18_13210 [Bryobacteraceae bacterium]|nr:hypothetical protein [Bryobacteraceae bacterium]
MRIRLIARITDIPVRRLRREIAPRGHDATRFHWQWRFARRQAVYVAIQRWTLAEIEDVFGADNAVSVLLPLLIRRTVTVRLLEFIVPGWRPLRLRIRRRLTRPVCGELIDFAGDI